MSRSEAPLGLIAGDGSLPLEVCRAARRQGRSCFAVAFPGIARPELAECADGVAWLALGQAQAMLDALADAGVRELVLAGKVAKTHLTRGSVELDARALAALGTLDDRRDDAVLGAVAALLAESGFHLLPQAACVPHLVARQGLLTKASPDEAQGRDIALGFSVAAALGSVDVGQTVVVENGAVLAVEAIEGTDAAIRRSGSLGRGGACVVKRAKPRQDPRFDVPTIGPDTVLAMRDAGARVLAVEADTTLVLERAALVERADEAGIAVLACAADEPGAAAGPPPSAGGAR